jgi:hypothetical protein
MNKLFLGLLSGIFLTFSSCSILEQAQEYERFIQCDFSLSNIQVLEISGIDISSLSSKGDLSMMDMMAITKQIFSNNFPATLSINLKASNKDLQQASIAGLDWKILMDNEELVSGLVDQEVLVKPQSSTTFPVIVQVDLMKLLRSESLGKIMAFAFGENQYQEISKLGAEIKIKPYYKTKSGIKKYPGYLSIKP